MRSWNVNAQREVPWRMTVGLGYYGSRGADMRLARNINQFVNGLRPYPALSAASPILPGTPLGNITEIDSAGRSTYHALWATAARRLSHGLQLNASYTWSTSRDINSLSASGVVVQNSYDLEDDFVPSDYDVRHRFVMSATYDVPFHDSALLRGWQLSAIVQSQGGNPANIVTSNSTVNGVANTLRPDVTGPVTTIGTVQQWFDTSVFQPVNGFGNADRNIVVGPGFNNTDVAIVKTMNASRVRLQVRAECFNLFNHPNFGQPGNIVGSPAFGRITSTRFPTGESGSSRQLQFAVKASF